MTKKRRWFWILLFIFAALLLSALATSWNVVLVKDYQYLLSLARFLSMPNEINLDRTQWFLVLKMILGTSGFIAVLALFVSLFIKLLSEMRLNQRQSEFLAAVSHELKTPIAAIELSADLLREGGLSVHETHHLWNSHQIELGRLKEEVNTLLEAARIQTRPKSIPGTSLNLDSWIKDHIVRWKKILGPESTFVYQGDLLNIIIQVDPRALDLIFDNLMSNSRKYARHKPEVLIYTRIIHSKELPTCKFKLLFNFICSRPKWQIRVQDSGWGFNPADSKRIFQRFFRSKTYAPYAIPGTGLGLFLAWSACRSMGLKLWAESYGPGTGATFILEGLISKC